VETQNITLQVADSEGVPATSSIKLSFVIKPPNPIAEVEFTQSIQQLQTLEELEATLTANNEPPVPIIANKPAVMRIYFTGAENAATYTVQMTGAIIGTKTYSVVPGCPPANQRADAVPCFSLDFYFIPPAGAWTAELTVADLLGDVIETEDFAITSRTTRSINLKGVSVANSSVGGPKPSVLLGMTSMVGAMMPTPQPVTVQLVPQRVFLSSTNYLQMAAWESDVIDLVKRLYTPVDAAADVLANQRTDYVGIYSNVVDPNGQATSMYSGHSIVIPDQNERLGDTNAVVSTLAHETGHTLGQVHTGIGAPHATVAPGCWAAGGLSPTTLASAAWPYSSNNVQSSAGPEYGFNVVTETVIYPTNTFDIMSYCDPRWISPFNYKVAIAGLGGGAVASPSVTRSRRPLLATPEAAPLAAPTLVQGSYWQVSGSILGTSATLDSIFTQTIQGTTDPGSGTYSIQEQNGSGQALYTRYFTPEISGTEALGGADYFSNPEFSEWIPVTAGASTIAVVNPDGNVLTSQALTGSAPIVTITSPAAGFVGSGQQTVSWTVQSPAPSLTARIFYSTDRGDTWQQADGLSGTSDTIDFSTLPGAVAALLRVDVSDGVNTGSATSIPFSVPKKVPSAIVINAPLNGAVQPAANPVYLSGSAYDVDDGVLTGTALQWTDNVEGALGSGSFLPVNLQPGTHTLTLTATDSDGNAVTATTTITLGGGRPVVTLTTNTLSTNCVSATIAATLGDQGASLSAVQYSLDGGNTYTAIPLTQLPFTFQVPGSGAVTLLAVALDRSGQLDAQSDVLSLGTGCAVTPPITTPTVTVTPSPLSITTAQAVTVTVAVSGNPAPTGSVTLTSANYSSAATTLSSGSATIDVPAGSLVVGSDTLTVSYAPDSNSSSTYNSASGTSLVTVNAAPSFTLSASAGALSVVEGSSNTDTVTISGANGFSGNVTLSASALPSGVTASFGTNPATGSSVLTLTAAGTATVGGPVTVTITGTSGLLTASTTIALTVNAEPTFVVGGSSSSLSIEPGATTGNTVAITVTPSNGFTGMVSLTCTITPAEASNSPTCTLTPSSVTISGTGAQSSTLTIITTAPRSAKSELKNLLWPSAGTALALLLFGIPRKRRNWVTMLGVFVLVVSFGVIGCGGRGGKSGGGGGGNSGTTPGTYSVTMTGTSGNITGTVGTVALTVQ
jgi:hypothetical protein